MAYIPELEPNETLALHIELKVSKKAAPFNFAVSNRAVYWPATKAFAMRDATYFRRIRNDEISEVSVKRLPPYGYWVIAALMVLVGTVISYLMLVPLINREPGEHQVSGWPFAIIVGGILMPFAARGRRGLEVQTLNKTYRWKPPFVIDTASKQNIQTTLDRIADACSKSGLRIRQD
jgi:hypothetical protein